MIEIHPKIHDRYTIEFKVGYIAKSDGAHNEFHMNTWIYIPEVLDINRHTYPKDNFYRDTRSYLRLITPQYLLGELTSEAVLPYGQLCRAFEQMDAQAANNGKVSADEALKQLEVAVKMYASIVKSSIRDACTDIERMADEWQMTAMAHRFAQDISTVLLLYRKLRGTVAGKETGWMKFYDYGDEFISNVVEQHAFRLMEYLRKRHHEVLEAVAPVLGPLLDKEEAYRKQRGYLCVEANSRDNNRTFVYHAGQLKKYIESNLYLPTHKRRNTVFLEQVCFSIAAGVSMVFATVVSFAFQQTYGNFTLPFFIALVISYMFKDRIKDLIRNYFANRIGGRFYDFLITILVNNRKIGWCKEGFDFVSPEKISKRVNEIRARKSPLVINRGVGEQVIQYRKYVHLKQKELKRLSKYPLPGINDIVRYNLKEFMRKMDNAQIPIYACQGNARYQQTNGDKVYYLNFVIQCKYDNQSEYKRYKVCLNRKGIKEIVEQ